MSNTTAPIQEAVELASQSKLIVYQESMETLPWQTDNQHILTGYRRQLSSITACLRSAIAYLHNETVNIHSHFLGAIFFLCFIPFHLIPGYFPWTPLPKKDGDTVPIPPTTQDKVAITMYLVCVVACLSLSSFFHTVQCHSQRYHDIFVRGDFAGIIILIVGTITTGLYYGFYNNFVPRVVYTVTMLVAGIASAYIVLSPRHRTHRLHRTLTFIALGLSAVVPILHLIITQGLAQTRHTISLDIDLCTGASYIIGTLFYIARFPERLAPGRFDYFGSSHQIFHIFVLVGAGLQYFALRGMISAKNMGIAEN